MLKLFKRTELCSVSSTPPLSASLSLRPSMPHIAKVRVRGELISTTTAWNSGVNLSHDFMSWPVGWQGQHWPVGNAPPHSGLLLYSKPTFAAAKITAEVTATTSAKKMMTTVATMRRLRDWVIWVIKAWCSALATTGVRPACMAIKPTFSVAILVTAARRRVYDNVIK